MENLQVSVAVGLDGGPTGELLCDKTYMYMYSDAWVCHITQL